MNIRFETEVQVGFKTVKENFNLKLFSYLSPPGIQVRVLRFDGCSPGHEVHVQLGPSFLGQKWVSVISQEELSDQGWFFVDEGRQLPWPLTSWKHLHQVVCLSDKSSRIVDDIQFKCVPGLTHLFYPLLWLTFAVRPSRYRKFFQG